MNDPVSTRLEDFDTEIIRRSVQPPPDGGYGWVCVATCFSINCFTWGIVAVDTRPSIIFFSTFLFGAFVVLMLQVVLRSLP